MGRGVNKRAGKVGYSSKERPIETEVQRQQAFWDGLRRGGRGRRLKPSEKQHLIDKGYFGEAMEAEGGSEFSAAVESAQKALSVHRVLKSRERYNQSRREQPPSQAVDGPRPLAIDDFIDPRDQKRAKVLGHELARLADSYEGIVNERGERHPLVRRVRERLFGGRVLSDDEADNLLLSQGLGLVPASVFAKGGIPLIGHTSTVTRRGATRQEIDRGVLSWFDVTFTWGRNTRSVAVPGFSAAPATQDIQVPLRIPGGAGLLQVERALPSSMLADLQKNAEKLARHYLWDVADSLRFILTGEAPVTPCFRAVLEGGMMTNHTHYRLTLSVEPWVTAESVTKVYKELQRRILHKKKVRPLRVDSLDLVDFVAAQRSQGKSWAEARDAWNETRKRPREKYTKRDQKNFQRDFEATYWILLHPASQGGKQ